MSLHKEGLGVGASSTAQDWTGGAGMLLAQGTFGGATLALEISADGGSTYVELAGGIGTAGENVPLAMDEPGAVNFSAPPCKIRATTTGGSGTDIDVYLLPIYDRHGAAR